MLWFIGFVLLGLVLFNFFNDVQKQESQMTAQGGIRKKYSVLIDRILSTLMNGQIFSERSDSLGIGTSHPAKGTYQYLLTQTFGKLTIQYKMDNPIFGKLNLEWVFDENTDQNTMYNKISEDVKAKTLDQNIGQINSKDYLISSGYYLATKRNPYTKKKAIYDWTDLLGDMSDSHPFRPIIEQIYIPNKLCEEKLTINRTVFNKINSSDTIQNHSFYKYISPSLKYFIDSPREITLHYPEWFYVAFPDVAYWLKNEDGFNCYKQSAGMSNDEIFECYTVKWVHLKNMIDLYRLLTSNTLECEVYP